MFSVSQSAAPTLPVRWFYSTDCPLRDPTRIQKQKPLPRNTTATAPHALPSTVTPSTSTTVTSTPTNPPTDRKASTGSLNTHIPSLLLPFSKANTDTGRTSPSAPNSRDRSKSIRSDSKSPVLSATNPGKTVASSVVTSATTPTTTSTLPVKTPTAWVAFSIRDSKALENAYANGDKGKKVPVNEDYLHEVDVEKKEIYPVYWPGPVYEVRRGTWYYATDGKGTVTPCDENLARQVEDGYRKHAPWKLLGSNDTSSDAATAHEKAASAPSGEIRWPLLGPYHDQSIVYVSPTQAWLVLDGILGKLAKAVWSKLSAQNMGGKLLIRGYEEALKVGKSNKEAAAKAAKEADKLEKSLDKKGLQEGKSSNSTSASSLPAFSTSAASLDNEETQQSEADAFAKAEEEKPEREINHLILVIHGIGQKLSEHMESVNFVNDVNLLRRTLKLASENVSSSGIGPSTSNSNLSQTASSMETPTTNCSSKNSLPSVSQPHPSQTAVTPLPPGMPTGFGVQVLPIQWRKVIKFGMAADPQDEWHEGDMDELQDHNAKDLADQGEWNDMADGDEQEEEDGPPTLEEITLEGVPTIRMVVSDVILDVLLYMTPNYRKIMLESVVKEMNRVYNLFVSRHPEFLERQGKVSIYGHSLGSVITFEVLCAQQSTQPVSSNPPNSGSSEELNHRNRIQLDFPVDNFFAVGSPIGLFLLLKGTQLSPRMSAEVAANAGNGKGSGEEGIQTSQPVCQALYNIFHKADPVAFRLEPLVARFRNADNLQRKPAEIPYLKGGLKGHLMNIQEVGSGVVRNVAEMYDAVRTAMSFPFIRILDRRSSRAAEGRESSGGNLSAVSCSGTEEGGNGIELLHHKRLLKPLERMRLLNPKTGRVDWSLQEGLLENPYISAIQAHVNYWGDYDVGMFLLRQCYGM